MKKLLFVFALGAMTLVACDEAKQRPRMADLTQNDSLQKIIAQKDNEINDMMGTLNEIQEGFRLINEAENRVSKNRELINKLKKQLRESSVKGDQLNKTLEDLVAQLEQKDQQLQQLRSELDAKDIHIGKLDETIATLNTDVENLKTESSQKTETINTQDKQLNTAWFVFGTKKELKEQRIIEDGRVLQANFNKNYFTKIDIRIDKEIKLYSKSAKLLTMHPSSSYTLAKDAKDQYVLRITNPQIFWSTSKYLVVLVK